MNVVFRCFRQIFLRLMEGILQFLPVHITGLFQFVIQSMAAAVCQIQLLTQAVHLIEVVLHVGQFLLVVRNPLFQFRQTPLGGIPPGSLPGAELGIRFAVGDVLFSGGGDGIDPPLQILVVIHGHFPLCHKGASGKHGSRRTDQDLTAVFAVQSLHRHAGAGIGGLKRSHGSLAVIMFPLQYDIPSVFRQLHGPLHGFAGPGLVFDPVRNVSFPGPVGGRHTVEHGPDERTPGALPALVGTDDDVEAVMKFHGVVIQTAEGRCHSINLQEATPPLHFPVRRCPSGQHARSVPVPDRWWPHRRP